MFGREKKRIKLKDLAAYRGNTGLGIVDLRNALRMYGLTIHNDTIDVAEAREMGAGGMRDDILAVARGEKPPTR